MSTTVHKNTSTEGDNHVLLDRTLSSSLPEMIKVGTALSLVSRGANIFEIDKNKVALWMETAAANGQWKLVDFFVCQLSNLQVVRSSSGAPSAVVESGSFKRDKVACDALRHKPTECSSDEKQQDHDPHNHKFTHV